MSHNFEQLKRAVIEKSVSQNWDDAVTEWGISGWDENESASSFCVCGKSGLRYLFKISNNVTGQSLSPVGSSCIERFERTDLYDEAKMIEDLFKLLHIYKEKRFISLRDFTRKLIFYLFDERAFYSQGYNEDNTFNNFLRCFNKKNELTPNEDKFTKAVIINNIIPYLRQKLRK